MRPSEPANDTGVWPLSSQTFDMESTSYNFYVTVRVIIIYIKESINIPKATGVFQSIMATHPSLNSLCAGPYAEQMVTFFHIWHLMGSGSFLPRPVLFSAGKSEKNTRGPHPLCGWETDPHELFREQDPRPPPP